MITFLTAEALPAIRLKASGPITSAFMERGVSSFRDAARLIAALPYRRNSARSDHLIVLRENKGTCSTKHSLLARLAQEQKLTIALCIGIYEMDGLNTPGVGPVLDAHCLASIPEAHCYLKRGSQRIDVTSARADRTRRPIERFLVELDIAPEQAGSYKSQFHQEFMRGWMKSASRSPVFSFDKLWAVREACIRALEIQS